MKTCTIPQCEEKMKCKEMCHKHYMRTYHGSKDITKSMKDVRDVIIDGETVKIPLGANAKKGYAIIDLDKLELISGRNWTLGVRGYPVSRQDTLHHVLFGKPKKGFVFDHINRDRLDNRAVNIREITFQQNAFNASIGKNNTSGYKGVWKTKSGTWKSDIKINYKKIGLGTYKNKDDAARAYNSAAKKYFGEYAVLNIIGD